MNLASRTARAAVALFCGISCGLSSMPLQAQGGGSTGLRVARPALELGYSRESLTNNNQDWTSSYLLGSAGLGDRLTAYGGLRETRRFGLDDSEAHAGLYFPITATWSGVVEGSFSQTYNVLPKNSVYGQLQKSLAGGWNIGLGLRQSEYATISSNVLTLLAERYWGNFRGAYTLYSGRPEGASSASSHRFQVNYYYTDRSTVGLSYSTGREVENVGPPRGVISTDVENWTLGGQHWLSPSWALTYDAVRHEQGSLYRRQGVRLGVRHSF